LLRHLENMNLMEKTAIIFTSDHGFYFGEHGGLFGKSVTVLEKDEKLVPIPWDRGGWIPAPYEIVKKGPSMGKESRGGWEDSPLYEEVAAVPLFIYVPGVAPGTCDGLTSAVDLMPTVLDIMGQEIPSFVEGRSLLPMVKDPSTQGREYVLTSEPFANPGEYTHMVDGIARPLIKAPITTITTQEWSLLYNIEPGMSELYNLKNDPQQEKNIISENVDVARSLHKLLVNFMRETNVSRERVKTRLELRL
jgi:arylsulfatase A-like enzyme